MNAEQVLASLTSRACRVDKLEARPAPGVYAYFLKRGSPLPAVSNRYGSRWA